MSRVQQSKNIVQWKDLSSWCFSGVRFHACLFHAPANARLWSPLSPVWKDLLKTVAVERTHADAHRRKAVRVSHLWKVILGQVKPEGSPSNSCGCKSEEIGFHFIHNPVFLHSLSTAADVEKNLPSSLIWWSTKRRDVPAAQQLRFWKCICEKRKDYTKKSQYILGRPLFAVIVDIGLYKSLSTTWVTSDYCYPHGKGLDLLNTCVLNKSFESCKVHFINAGSFKC